MVVGQGFLRKTLNSLQETLNPGATVAFSYLAQTQTAQGWSEISLFPDEKVQPPSVKGSLSTVHRGRDRQPKENEGATHTPETRRPRFHWGTGAFVDPQGDSPYWRMPRPLTSRRTQNT